MSRTRFLADNDVSEPILEGVLRRVPSFDVCRARDVGLRRVSDDDILRHAAQDQRIVLSHDVNTMRAAAIRRIRARESCTGLVLIPQDGELSAIIDDLVLIDAATEMKEWFDRIEFIPF
jgi:hypothetical protein